MYDNKGNVVPEETVDEEPDVLEPYDMEYLKDKSESGFKLSRTEEHFMACVRKLEDELKRQKGEVRVVWKMAVLPHIQVRFRFGISHLPLRRV